MYRILSGKHYAVSNGNVEMLNHHTWNKRSFNKHVKKVANTVVDVCLLGIYPAHHIMQGYCIIVVIYYKLVQRLQSRTKCRKLTHILLWGRWPVSSHLQLITVNCPNSHNTYSHFSANRGIVIWCKVNTCKTTSLLLKRNEPNDLNKMINKF